MPLLELDQTSQIKIEFQINNQSPHMEIENDIDLLSAFYTCNEIKHACLHVKINMNEELS